MGLHINVFTAFAMYDLGRCRQIPASTSRSEFAGQAPSEIEKSKPSTEVAHVVLEVELHFGFVGFRDSGA